MFWKKQSSFCCTPSQYASFHVNVSSLLLSSSLLRSIIIIIIYYDDYYCCSLTQSTCKLGLGKAWPLTKGLTSSLSNFEQPSVENLPVLISSSFSPMSTFSFTDTHDTCPKFLKHFHAVILSIWQVLSVISWVAQIWVFPYSKWWYPQSPPQVLIIFSRRFPMVVGVFPTILGNPGNPKWSNPKDPDMSKERDFTYQLVRRISEPSTSYHQPTATVTYVFVNLSKGRQLAATSLGCEAVSLGCWGLDLLPLKDKIWGYFRHITGRCCLFTY